MRKSSSVFLRPDPLKDELEIWFEKEILPHEATLMRYLARRWIRSQELHDLRHEVYVRVLESAATRRPTSPCGFLLGVARNLMIDRIRRERIVSIDLMEDVDALNVLVDDVSAERAAIGRQQLQRLAQVFEGLPLRCRQVVWMRRIEGLSQKDIAKGLGIAESTVEKHLIRGIGLLADGLYAADGNNAPSSVQGRPRRRAGLP
jgi:RNA polymerase sigma factor (sigma-70 family)